MLLAIASHYSAVICFAAIGIVWFSRLLIQRESVKEYYKIALAHLPPLGILIMLYVYHVSFQTAGGGIYTEIKQTYLVPLFPHTLSGFINNTAALFRYLFFPTKAKWLILFTMAGFISLCKSSHKHVATTILFAFLLAFVLTYLNAYPFGGSRHSIYLFPFIALLIGASVQTGCDFLYHVVIPFLKKRSCFRGKNLQAQFLHTCTACLVASTLIITFYFKQHDFLRNFGEFPLKQGSCAKLNAYLKPKLSDSFFIPKKCIRKWSLMQFSTPSNIFF
jgi:hypothetical protein